MKPKEKKTSSRPLYMQPSSVKKLEIKCVWSNPVNANNAPSGKKYSFKPGQKMTITNKPDYDYLLSLNKEAGCCGGAGRQPRTYFEAV